jgi:hypothetical protein
LRYNKILLSISVFTQEKNKESEEKH